MPDKPRIASFIRHILTGLLCAVVAFMPDIATAQLKPLPELQKLTADEFVRTTQEVQKDFEEDRRLKFQFQILKEWQEEDFINLKNLNRRDRLFGPVTEFKEPATGGVRAYFRVTSEEIDREISARNWLVTYVLDHGHTLRSLEERGPESFETMYVAYSGRDAFAVRAYGQRMGPRMILAEYAVPLDKWEQMMDYQTLTIKSFKITSDDKETIEERRYYAYLQAIELSYPKSWRLDNEQTSVENKLHFELINTVDGEAVLGQIAVDVISTRSVKDLENITIFQFDPIAEIKAVRDRYERKYKVTGLLEKKKYDLPEEVKFQATDVYALEPIVTIYDSNEDVPDTHELWFTVISHGTRYISVALLTPARDQDLYNWAINTEAYRRVIETIKFQ